MIGAGLQYNLNKSARRTIDALRTRAWYLTYQYGYELLLYTYTEYLVRAKYSTRDLRTRAYFRRIQLYQQLNTAAVSPAPRSPRWRTTKLLLATLAKYFPILRSRGQFDEKKPCVRTTVRV